MRWWWIVVLTGCATASGYRPGVCFDTNVPEAPTRDVVRPRADALPHGRADHELPADLEALRASATRVAHTAPFPTPPMQGQPWDLAPGTSPELAAWIRLQFGELRMPDPRGCELRWVVLTVGDGRGRALEVVTTAYVLPHDPFEPAFAIAWNGMMYQAAAVGEPVTLDEALARTSPEALLGVRSRGGSSKLVPRYGWEALEATSVTSPNIGIAAISQPTDTSASYWTECASQPGTGFCIRVFAWAFLGRALNAQASGDDWLGVASIRHAVALRAVADRMSAELTHDEARALYGWGRMDELARDLERRVLDPVDPVAMAAALESPREHIAYLVSELDETVIQAEGSVGIRVSPPLDALAALGLEPLDALVDAMDDARLVRRGLSLQVSDMAWDLVSLALARHRPWISVDACAPFRSSEPASCARAAIDAAPSDPLAGWMSVLEDDTARQRWGEAAARIARPPLVSCRAWEPTPSLTDSESRPWRDCRALDAGLDEAARAALRALLMRRLREHLAAEEHAQRTCDIAMALVGLGGPGVVDALRETSHSCEGSRGSCECETELTVARAAMGDESALPEWTVRLRRVGPRIDFATPRFAPGWLWPDRADVQDAIRDVLADTPPEQAVIGHVGPVLGSPAVREWILSALQSEEEVGEWRFHSNGGVWWGSEASERLGACSGPVVATAPLLLRERVALRFVAGTDDVTRAALTSSDARARASAVDHTARSITELPWGATAGPSTLYDWDGECAWETPP